MSVIPLFAQFSAVLACCFLVYRLWYSGRVLCCSFCFFVSLFAVFLLFLFCFLLFLVFRTLLSPRNLLFSLSFSCCFVPNANSSCLRVYGGYLITHHTPTMPPIFSVVVMWRPRHPCDHFPHTHMLAQNMSYSPINYSFCLVLRVLCAHAYPCAHPNSLPHS